MDQAELTRIIEAKFDRYAQQVIDCLEGCPAELSGEDSPMANVWEEWVVQVRGEHSVYYSTYESTVRGACDGVVDDLPKDERALLWGATDASWDFEEGQRPAEQEIVSAVEEELFNRVNNIAESMKLPERLERYLCPPSD